VFFTLRRIFFGLDASIPIFLPLTAAPTADVK